MNDQQIDFLKKLLNNKQTIHWNGVKDCYKKISHITEIDDTGDGTKEPVAYLDGKEYIALWNCEPKDFVIINTITLF